MQSEICTYRSRRSLFSSSEPETETEFVASCLLSNARHKNKRMLVCLVVNVCVSWPKDICKLSQLF